MSSHRILLCVTSSQIYMIKAQVSAQPSSLSAFMILLRSNCNLLTRSIKKVCKQGRDDIIVKVNIQSPILTLQLYSSVEKMQEGGFVCLSSLSYHPYLVCILFGVPSLRFSTFFLYKWVHMHYGYRNWYSMYAETVSNCSDPPCLMMHEWICSHGKKCWNNCWGLHSILKLVLPARPWPLLTPICLHADLLYLQLVLLLHTQYCSTQKSIRQDDSYTRQI